MDDKPKKDFQRYTPEQAMPYTEDMPIQDVVDFCEQRGERLAAQYENAVEWFESRRQYYVSRGLPPNWMPK